MDTSIFPDKSKLPTVDDLKASLQNNFEYWIDLRNFVFTQYPAAIEEWNFPGVKYGWSFRIKDKKRAIIYFLPRENYFLAAFVFGQKATDVILNNDFSDEIKSNLQNAKKYAEGRGIRIEVKDSKNLEYIKKLVLVKIAN